MLYLNEADIQRIGIDWEKLILQIEETVHVLNRGETAQPIKPYLRFKNMENRIIAMPAYVGGNTDLAGIKWIASFPNNRAHKLPRAHNIVILNNADTGQPVAIFNTNLLSVLRTAAVSGLLLKLIQRIRPNQKVYVGIIGWGPIGQYHYKMCSALLGHQVNGFMIYDSNQEIRDSIAEQAITKCKGWEEVYTESDIVITCTVAKQRYIHLPPRKGHILLNVSLRDYQLDAIKGINKIIVDDWEEVCRENTDIALLAKGNGLTKDQTLALVDIVCHDALAAIDKQETLFFNPMGMAVFDIAIAAYYYQLAINQGIGRLLD